MYEPRKKRAILTGEGSGWLVMVGCFPQRLVVYLNTAPDTKLVLHLRGLLWLRLGLAGSGGGVTGEEAEGWPVQRYTGSASAYEKE